MRVLVAFESSGEVRRAFRDGGHESWSCDLLDSDDGSQHHYQEDAFHTIELYGPWDLVVAHPPCTALAVSGNRWYSGSAEREKAIGFVRDLADLLDANATRWAIENPVGVLSSAWRKPDQYIQPWEHGHGETKKTGLWLRGLRPLVPTDIVEGREQRVWRMGPSANRWKERSKTYTGIARAMASQWGSS